MKPCNCYETLRRDGKLTDPIELAWYAYLHKNGTLHVKRWLATANGKICDLCHLIEEEASQPNSLIQLYIAKPFYAKSRDEALYIAAQVMKPHSLEQDGDDSRFSSLDLD